MTLKDCQGRVIDDDYAVVTGGCGGYVSGGCYLPWWRCSAKKTGVDE